MKKIALILSGCGVYDGSEIHEATLSMLALSKNNIEYDCFAPNQEQYHVINHLTGEVTNEKRNVLVESARIARGNIKALSELNHDIYDGLVIPGGVGAAKNLSNYAINGAEYTVNDEIAKLITKFHNAKKPIVALCIAPMLIAKVLGAKITIGNDKETASIVESVGAKHINKEYNEIAIDEDNKIITNPCYMTATSIYQVSIGAEKAIEAMLDLMD